MTNEGRAPESTIANQETVIAPKLTKEWAAFIAGWWKGLPSKRRQEIKMQGRVGLLQGMATMQDAYTLDWLHGLITQADGSSAEAARRIGVDKSSAWGWFYGGSGMRLPNFHRLYLEYGASDEGDHPLRPRSIWILNGYLAAAKAVRKKAALTDVQEPRPRGDEFAALEAFLLLAHYHEEVTPRQRLLAVPARRRELVRGALESMRAKYPSVSRSPISEADARWVVASLALPWAVAVWMIAGQDGQDAGPQDVAGLPTQVSGRFHEAFRAHTHRI